MGMKNLKGCFLQHSSKNVAFREFARSDVFPLFEATKKDSFNRYLLWSAPNQLSGLIDMIEDFMNQGKNDEIIFLSIIEKFTGSWLGVAKFIPYDDGIEASFWTHPNYHGKLVVIEAFESSLDIALNNRLNAKVYGRVIHGNEKAHKLVTKTGFKKIGEVNSLIPIFIS
jgi:RimJ/RimL family protein N-acetyltransferase